MIIFPKKDNPYTSGNDSMIFPGKHREKAIKIRILKKSLIICLFALLVTVILFIVSGYFRITEITVTGDSVYSDNVIISASGIGEGDRLTDVGTGSIRSKLLKELPYLKDAEVTVNSISGITIHVTGYKQLWYVKYGEMYYAVLGDLSVVSKSTEEIDMSGKGGAFLELPEFYPVEMGEQIKFRLPVETDKSETTGTEVTPDNPDYSGQADKKFGYITGLLKLINESGFAGKVTKVCASDKYNLSFYCLDGKVCVILGNTDRLEEKLVKVWKSVSEKELDGSNMSVDISDPSYQIWRVITDSNKKPAETTTAGTTGNDTSDVVIPEG